MVNVKMVQQSITTSKPAQLILVRVSEDDKTLELVSFQSSGIHIPTLPGSIQWPMEDDARIVLVVEAGVDADVVVGVEVMLVVGTVTQAPEEQSSEATQMAPRGSLASQSPNRHRCEAQSTSILQLQ